MTYATTLDEVLALRAEIADDPVADLHEVEAYFDDRADSDDGRPNDAMRNLGYVRAAINTIGRLRAENGALRTMLDAYVIDEAGHIALAAVRARDGQTEVNK